MRPGRLVFYVTFVALALALMLAGVKAQSGKGSVASRRTVTLNVIVHAPEGRTLTRDDFDLYDAGNPQEIESFAKLDS
ncbi:MAG TPA: hypothetical protein VE821_06930, partial [Pyrinomonadaceae bacterium]|nr:hypothetical protein [Pyrinomonadaceae bacterium]